MTVAASIATGLAAWAVVASAVGIGLGRMIHAADHREGRITEPGCGCGRHRMRDTPARASTQEGTTR